MMTRGQNLWFATQAKKLFILLFLSLKTVEAEIHQTSEEIIPNIRTFQNLQFSCILHSRL